MPLHQRLRLLISQTAPCFQGVMYFFAWLPVLCFSLRRAALEAGTRSSVMKSDTDHALLLASPNRKSRPQSLA